LRKRTKTRAARNHANEATGSRSVMSKEVEQRMYTRSRIARAALISFSADLQVGEEGSACGSCSRIKALGKGQANVRTRKKHENQIIGTYTWGTRHATYSSESTRPSRTGSLRCFGKLVLKPSINPSTARKLGVSRGSILSGPCPTGEP
jgi:hypothetical protein